VVRLEVGVPDTKRTETRSKLSHIKAPDTHLMLH